MQPHLLIVDDDKRIRELLQKYLIRQGFLVSIAEGAAHAKRLLSSLIFDMIVLDIMMPDQDGLSLTLELRSHTDTPIILLTARNETEDRINGLEAGADDYLPKPFEPKELLLRIHAILRRVPDTSTQEALPQVLSIGLTRYDVQKGELWKGGKQVRLTGTETELMQIFAGNIGQPLRRSDLVTKMGKFDENSHDRSIDVQITRLRRKIEQNPREPRYLKTVRGLGYLLSID